MANRFPGVEGTLLEDRRRESITKKLFFGNLDSLEKNQDYHYNRVELASYSDIVHRRTKRNL